ncbi:hypothetical protein SOCEGT47_059860 [Sorangium cellulosum]|uniref:DUF4351 domain-containing protein n=1 Tax=Sorangium cellulosum TaxID=56 RepID=A0A4P2Q7L2_SORCE|nr:hypothetical protein [Sorangium cellulosum]AUX25439.1 hypothetical protein SOCEGT47_059860 [Sorangium cellulosum]
MPTLEHNALVEMFREHPELAPHVLATLFHVEVPPHASVAVVESSLDQLIPAELRADLVLELRDANGRLVLAIVLEVQRNVDPDKKFSWPAYVTGVRARRRCGAVVLVVAPDAGVAAWAAESIDLGLGRGHVEPLVLGPAVVPEITDLADAEKEAELAVLSAMAHGNGPNGLTVLQAALAALGRLDQEHAMVYFQLIWDGLREPMQQALEALVMERQIEGEATLPPFVQRLIDRGKLEGELKGMREGMRQGELKGMREGMRQGELKGMREGMRQGELKGMREGKLEGMRQGELKGKKETLLRLLARAGIALAESESARIQACSDIATLDRWIENVLGAKTATEVLS